MTLTTYVEDDLLLILSSLKISKPPGIDDIRIGNPRGNFLVIKKALLFIFLGLERFLVM